LINRIISAFSIVLFLFCGVVRQAAFSQNLKDTLHLTEVEIKSSFAPKNEGFKRVTIDSSFLIHHIEGDLSSILNSYSTIFVKSYGIGKLATVSFRGTSANHTDVEWNGISINSPMLGQMDISQVPVSQFDAIEVLYGASGISRTGGAFGGVINLVTNPEWENKINVNLSQTIASFSTYNTAAHIALGNTHFQSVTKFNYTNSLNDFLYFDDVTQSWLRLKNSSYNQLGLTEELFYRVNPKNFLSGKIWYSEDFKSLSPKHVETLKDKSWRSLVEWKLLQSHYSVTVRSAFIDQFMNYRYESVTDDNHRYYSSANRVRVIWSPVEKLKIKPGADLNYDWVFSDSYTGTKTRSTISAFSDFTYDVSNKVGLSLVLREDVIDGKFLPVIPALGATYTPFKKVNLTFSANLSRNYRYPSLNDLYWNALGNPDLKPEKDYSAEGGITFNHTSDNEKFFIESQLTGYYTQMFDLILWKPDSAKGAWRPVNVNEVKSRGVEVGLNFRYNLAGFSLSLNNNYHYCRSTYASISPGQDFVVGNQVIYIPVHQANSSLNLKKWEFFASYLFYYVSGRYDGTDNQSIMPGYYLSDIILGKNFLFRKFKLSLQLKINNLFDLDYQSIKSYPEPGRNYAFTLRLSFKK
jgi:outer membrane cobalamin receptor